MKATSNLSCISLYTGAGGLDLGFEAAGFEHRSCIESDLLARSTLQHNRSNWGLLETPNALDVCPVKLRTELGLKPGDLGALIGGPPCQPFSKSAYWSKGETKRLSDPRADTLRVMMQFVDAMLPRVLVIENVKGISYKNKDEAISFIQRWLRLINHKHGVDYQLSVNILKANEFGVPQLRERAFLIAFRDGHEASIASPKDSLALTTWNAIGDIKLSRKERANLSLKGKWADLLPSIPEGENYLWHTERGGGLPLFGWRTRYWSFLLKLAKNKPSWTLQASPGPATGPFHWENRLLSPIEMSRLQTFPDNYEVQGSYSAKRKQYGNAVPPALAEAVAVQIKNILEPKLPVQKQTSFRQCYVARTRRSKVHPVAQKYLSLSGSHANHPGTGKGPGAVNRLDPSTDNIESDNLPDERSKHLNPSFANSGIKNFPSTKIA